MPLSTIFQIDSKIQIMNNEYTINWYHHKKKTWYFSILYHHKTKTWYFSILYLTRKKHGTSQYYISPSFCEYKMYRESKV